MKTVTDIQKDTLTFSFLHELVDKLMISSAVDAARNKVRIYNDISQEIELKTDQQIVSIVLGGLLHSISKDLRNTEIIISSKVYNDIVLLHFKDLESGNTDALYNGFQKLQPLVEKIGGFLDITSVRSYETTIAFSFPNLKDVYLSIAD